MRLINTAKTIQLNFLPPPLRVGAEFTFIVVLCGYLAGPNLGLILLTTVIHSQGAKDTVVVWS